jgi:hypothetical protein
MTKIVFHAFSAFVGSVSGRTTCAFWTDDPSSAAISWDSKLLKPVDLSKTPSAARAKTIKWNEVEVDDYLMNGGLTTLGPLFPGGQMIGAVWLTEDYMKKVGLDPTHKPGHAHGHELRSILYDGDPKYGDRRFQGFHAKVAPTPPAMAGAQKVTRVQIWNAGTGKGGGHAGHWWLDLDDLCDMDESDVGAKGAPEGSLYLDSSKKQIYLAGGGTGPKIPPGQGR